MDENVKKELMWASGALLAFVVFLIVGGISDIADMAITVGAFAISWLGVSYFIKNYGPGHHSIRCPPLLNFVRVLSSKCSTNF